MPELVLHVVSGTMYGGGQRVVLDLLKGMSDIMSVPPRLCALGRTEGSPLTARADDEVEYDGRYHRPHVLWRTSRSLARVIAETKPALIHTHGWDADIIGALAVRKTGLSQVAHIHVTADWLESPQWKHRVRRGITRRYLSPRHVRTIAVAHSVRSHLCQHMGWDEDDVVVVQNGVDLDRFPPSEDGQTDTGPYLERGARLELGTAARLAPQKGVEFLIDALGQLKLQSIPFRCRIAGTGRSAGDLEARCRQQGVAEEVEFLGQVDDMRAFYANLDTFVLPSLSEGLPLVVLEAMAMRVPVVATRVAGTPEVIDDGVEGLLVPPRDAGSLAKALQRMAGDRAMRIAMGRRGEQRVRGHFGLDRVARGVRDVYTTLLGSAHAPGAGT